MVPTLTCRCANRLGEMCPGCHPGQKEEVQLPGGDDNPHPHRRHLYHHEPWVRGAHGAAREPEGLVQVCGREGEEAPGEEKREAEPGDRRYGADKAPESGGPLRAAGVFLVAEVPTRGATCPLVQGNARQGSERLSEQGLEERGGEGSRLGTQLRALGSRPVVLPAGEVHTWEGRGR